MDTCHRCHDVVDIYRPIILVTTYTRPRAYCNSCFDLIRVRALRFLLRKMDYIPAKRLLDTLPPALPALRRAA